MSIRTTLLVNNENYHIYNRGNSKQVIFHDDYDYRYFMNLLEIMNDEIRSKTHFVPKNHCKKKIVSIGAFCLMPNHFHILIQQEKEKGITLFMQKLSTAYVMYYNKKYKRTGGLFEGKFKSQHAGEDRYLKYLFSYIHLNPLKLIDINWKSNGLNLKKKEFLIKYPYSSFLEYVNETYTYVCKDKFPDYFPTRKAFIKEISAWIAYDDF